MKTTHVSWHKNLEGWIFEFSGESKRDKRRTPVPGTASSEARSSGSSRLEATADEPPSPSPLSPSATSVGSSAYRLSPSLRSKREKFESADGGLTSPHVTKPHRSSRQVSLGLLFL